MVIWGKLPKPSMLCTYLSTAMGKYMAENRESGAKPAEKPISLQPLEFGEAVESLLKLKPESREMDSHNN